jgi:hypothetical protein
MRGSWGFGVGYAGMIDVGGIGEILDSRFRGKDG